MNSVKPVCIIGGGSFGTAIASLLATKNICTRLIIREEDVCQKILETRENSEFLPGITLSPLITPTTDVLAGLHGCETIIFAVPSPFLRETARIIAGLTQEKYLIVNLAKGIEQGSGKILTDVLEEEFRGSDICCLSGPSLALELARKYPSSCVIASKNKEMAEKAQKILASDIFRIYTSTDIIGVQLGGALKNAIAIAAGICDGLGWGSNTIAALITRGIVEITRMGIAYGARAETFQGMSGMGDLIVTCMSPLSRNHSLGKQLAEGKTLQEIQSSTRMIAEGVEITRVIFEESQKRNVELPIINAVHEVLFQGKKPLHAVKELLNRKLIHES